MKTIAIMQPTYLPWIGYFDLIDQSDCFVFLESVQFNKRSWQQRNRIRTARGLEWLTLPVYSKGKYNQLICETKIVMTSSFPDDHLSFIQHNYGKARFFERYYESLRGFLTSASEYLSPLNQSLIIWMSDQFGISTSYVTSSNIDVGGKRGELLAAICHYLEADVYLSTHGSRDYLLNEAQSFTSRSIAIRFHHYEHPSYEQVYAPFIPFASALDLLFNEGNSSLEIIRSGRRSG